MDFHKALKNSSAFDDTGRLKVLPLCIPELQSAKKNSVAKIKIPIKPLDMSVLFPKDELQNSSKKQNINKLQKGHFKSPGRKVGPFSYTKPISRTHRISAVKHERKQIQNKDFLMDVEEIEDKTDFDYDKAFKNAIAFDETGRLKVLPLHIPEFQSAKENLTTKIKIPIAPLDIDALFANEDIQNPPKKQANNKSLKQIFKAPERKVGYSTNKTRKSRISTGNRKAQKYDSLCKDAEATELHITKGLKRTVSFPASMEQTPLSQTKNIDNFLKRDDSVSEFLSLEAAVNVDIGNSKEGKPSGSQETINTIVSLIQEGRIEFENLKQSFLEFEKKSENRMDSVLNMLSSLENKENVTVNAQSIPPKIFGTSPHSDQPYLRKSVLLQSLKNTSIVNTPRSRNAVALYNSCKNVFIGLSTPKKSLNVPCTPQGSNRKTLSYKLQKQCLLLQDTPKI